MDRSKVAIPPTFLILARLHEQKGSSGGLRDQAVTVNSDVIDAQWNIRDNQFLPITVNRALHQTLSKVLPLGAPSAELLLHKYTIYAQVMVQGYLDEIFPVTQSGLVAGRWRRVALVAGAGNTPSHPQYDIVPLQFDDPVMGGCDVIIRALGPDGNPTDQLRTFQVLGAGAEVFTIDLDWDGLDDQGHPFPFGDAKAFIHAQVAERNRSVAEANLEATLTVGTRQATIIGAHVDRGTIDLGGTEEERTVHFIADIQQSGFLNPIYQWIYTVTAPDGSEVTNSTGSTSHVDQPWTVPADFNQTGNITLTLQARVIEGGGGGGTPGILARGFPALDPGVIGVTAPPAVIAANFGCTALSFSDTTLHQAALVRSADSL